MPRTRTKNIAQVIDSTEAPTTVENVRRIVTRSHAHEVDESNYIAIPNNVKTTGKRTKKAKKSDSTETSNENIRKKRNRKTKKGKISDIEDETVRKAADDTDETTFHSVNVNESVQGIDESVQAANENEAPVDTLPCINFEKRRSLRHYGNLSMSLMQQIDISQNDSILDKPSSTMLEGMIESEQNKSKRMPLSSIYSGISRISGIAEITLSDETIKPPTPRRENTFTKDDTSVNQSVKKHTFSAASPCKLFKSQLGQSMLTTPPRSVCQSISVGSAGCTPMPPLDKEELRAKRSVSQLPDSTPKGKVRPLNVTHSVEKPEEVLTKTNNRVTFVSPSSQRLPFVQNTSNIIKSSLKSTSKSILVANKGTQRTNAKPQTFTNILEKKKNRGISKLPKKVKKHFSEAKEKQIASIIQSACKVTPAKTNDKVPQPLSRSKMPNFASLHQKQFDQMESLVQLKARKEQRAKQLFTTTTPNYMKGLKGKDASAKKETSDTMLPPPNFTRFGFKVNSSGFKSLPTIAYKDSPRPKLPTPHRSASKIKAREIVMKDKPTTVLEDARNENRHFIAGVRTNRRFELQMRARKLET
ncbi:mitotic spindle and nuclear protein [Arctopsyche grandis]|uniref:mitotic spindle and nuclear protein n=1 Tax=Arctopsyche grandis TaxID=121162 RepID=UPI00406D9AC1